jgi:hypothetical protein
VHLVAGLHALPSLAWLLSTAAAIGPR